MDLPKICLDEILMAFDFNGKVTETLRYGQGHIHDTFEVYAKQPDDSIRRFILQRLNTFVFKEPDKLMKNILGITEYLRKVIEKEGGDPKRETLTLLKDRENQIFHTTSDGGIWRAYDFIEGTISYQRATPELFAASARAFGRFVAQLSEYPTHTLYEVIPNFHDTRIRYKNFEKVLLADPLGRMKDCIPEIEFIREHKDDCAVLMDMLDEGKLPLRVTHNDTKLNNVLIDPITNEGVCVVDLDTVMPGLVMHDYGDSIRFGANTADEDERNLDTVHFDMSMYEKYTAGFLQMAGSVLTKNEIEMLPWGARLMPLECGIRFLTDYLEGDVYFHTDRQKQNLDRCRTQFKMVEEIKQNWDEMNCIVCENFPAENSIF